MTTDTPRTDAAAFGSMTDSWELEQLSRQLEQELSEAKAEVERLKVINAHMRNFLAKAIHNEGFNEEQALKFIYQ